MIEPGKVKALGAAARCSCCRQCGTLVPCVSVRGGGVCEGLCFCGLPEANTTTAESVDHPAHYGGDGNAYEAIRVIEAMGDGPAFCRGNAIKYLMRHDKKGAQLDDLKKARWYVDRMIEQLEGGEGV